MEYLLDLQSFKDRNFSSFKPSNITIKENEVDDFNYVHKTPAFLIKDINIVDDNKIVYSGGPQYVTAFPRCREMICSSLSSYIRNTQEKNVTPIAISKNIAIGIKFIPVKSNGKTIFVDINKKKEERDIIIKKFLKSLHIINIIEKHFGWELSSIHKVTTPKADNQIVDKFVKVLMIHFSPNWFISQHTLSLALGLLRMTANDIYKGVRSYNGIYVRNKKIINSYKNLRLIYSNTNYNEGMSSIPLKQSDHRIILETQQYWDLFFKNLKNIYSDDYRFYNAHGHEGFRMLSLTAHRVSLLNQTVAKNFVDIIKTPIDHRKKS